jgi:hypothetical protein
VNKGFFLHAPGEGPCCLGPGYATEVKDNKEEGKKKEEEKKKEDEDGKPPHCYPGYYYHHQYPSHMIVCDEPATSYCAIL